MDEDKHELIEVECPICGTKDKREKAVLEIFAYGCKGCGLSFKHPLMQQKEYREEQEKKLN